MNKQQQSARDAAISQALDQLPDEGDRGSAFYIAECRRILEMLYDAAKAEPPDLKSILLEIVCNYPEAIEQIKAMENVTAAHYGLAYGVTPALFVSHGYDGVQDRVRLREKPQQPDPAESTAEQSEVCEADGHPKPLTRDGLFAYFDQMSDANGRIDTTADWLADTAMLIVHECEQRQPATPPASEPSRDAMVELINNEWVKYINDTGGRKVEEWFADFCLDQLARFAGQRAEVAHEHNALCTIAYDDGQRAERERIAKELQELFDKPDAVDILPHYLREYIDGLTGEAK